MESHRKSMLGLTLFLLVLTLLAAVGVFYGLQKTAEVRGEKKSPLVTAFQESGSTFRELTVQGWAELPRAYATMEAIKGEYQRILPLLGGEGDFILEEHEDDTYVGLTATGKTAAGYEATVTLQSITDRDTTNAAYLIIELGEKLDAAEAPAMESLTKACFEKAGATGELSILLTGVYPRCLSDEEKAVVAKKVFFGVDAKICEKVAGETYASQSGYCAAIEDVVISKKEKINLQVALFDNEITEETYLHIGSPLIFSEY